MEDGRQLHKNKIYDFYSTRKTDSNNGRTNKRPTNTSNAHPQTPWFHPQWPTELEWPHSTYLHKSEQTNWTPTDTSPLSITKTTWQSVQDLHTSRTWLWRHHLPPTNDDQHTETWKTPTTLPATICDKQHYCYTSGKTLPFHQLVFIFKLTNKQTPQHLQLTLPDYQPTMNLTNEQRDINSTYISLDHGPRPCVNRPCTVQAKSGTQRLQNNLDAASS